MAGTGYAGRGCLGRTPHSKKPDVTEKVAFDNLDKVSVEDRKKDERWQKCGQRKDCRCVNLDNKYYLTPRGREGGGLRRCRNGGGRGNYSNTDRGNKGKTSLRESRKALNT